MLRLGVHQHDGLGIVNYLLLGSPLGFEEQDQQDEESGQSQEGSEPQPKRAATRAHPCVQPYHEEQQGCGNQSDQDHAAAGGIQSERARMRPHWNRMWTVSSANRGSAANIIGRLRRIRAAHRPGG